jgi:hypothetical protein
MEILFGYIVMITMFTGFGVLMAEISNILIGFSFIFFLHLHLYLRICLLLLIDVLDVHYFDNIPFHCFTCRDACLDAPYNIRHTAISS